MWFITGRPGTLETRCCPAEAAGRLGSILLKRDSGFSQGGSGSGAGLVKVDFDYNMVKKYGRIVPAGIVTPFILQLCRWDQQACPGMPAAGDRLLFPARLFDLEGK
ncbi:hypothetical protein A6M21_04485 [Desulfotomaculum copahuensis]|uniref:Uncharacterized protein n=1 Tax=Desulfotomaculum copahuensis TaxID=1838280 RepID=A0A1B7LHI8_9FIRM|nr:hypothetical protein A6M21_04485 [Desulfotomaculum copahuensis]